MAADQPAAKSRVDMKWVAHDHQLKCSQEPTNPLKSLLVCPQVEAPGKVKGIPSKMVGTVLSNICPGVSFRRSVVEAEKVFLAQGNVEQMPTFTLGGCPETEYLPGGAPIIDHLIAYLEAHWDWYRDLKPILGMMSAHRLPDAESAEIVELTLGVSSDEEWKKARELLRKKLEEDHDNRLYFAAADTEKFSADTNWGGLSKGLNSVLDRVTAAREDGRKSLQFDNAVTGKPGVAFPVRFFIGGVNWQIHVRLPVVYSVAKRTNLLTLDLTTKVSSKVKKFFSKLPHAVGCDITGDYLEWSRILHAVWGEDVFQVKKMPIELKDLSRLAGVCLGQNSMFMLNWLFLGTVLPKDQASRGDNCWGREWKEIPPSLQRYLVGDTAQPSIIATLCMFVWTLRRFPDATWIFQAMHVPGGYLLDWVSGYVFKDLASGWREVRRHSDGHWTGFKIIPDIITQVGEIGSMEQLLACIGIPEGPRWDILRQDPGWPALTSGGPKFLHTARHYMNSLLPFIRGLDMEKWPLLHVDQMALYRFGVPAADVETYPQVCPDLGMGWHPNPGVILDIPAEPSEVTPDIVRRDTSIARGARAKLLEYTRLYPHAGRDLIIHFNKHPKQFKDIMGKHRFRQVIDEMRSLVGWLGLESTLPEGVSDPFQVHKWTEQLTLRATSHMEKELEQLRHKGLATLVKMKNIEEAIAATKEGADQPIDTLREYNLVCGSRKRTAAGTSRADKEAQAGQLSRATVASGLSPSRRESSPAPKRRVVERESPEPEGVDLFIDETEMEEFGPG